MNLYADRVTDFLLKKSFDFDRPDIDLYNFHPQLRIFLATNGIFFNNKDSRLRLIWPCICFQISLVGLSLELTCISHAVEVQDYSYATECFCYFVIVGCIPMTFISLAINHSNIYKLVEEMDRDFKYVCGLGPKYRKPFLEGQLMIWQLCAAWFSFVCFVGGLFALFPYIQLVYQTLFTTQDEFTQRPLQFPLWLPNDDPYRTPNYEIFLFIESTVVFCFVQTFCVYVYTFFHTMLHKYFMLSMIILDFEALFEGLDETTAMLPRDDPRRVQTQLALNKRFARIVEWHISVLESVKLISSLYGPTLVYQVMFSSIVICAIAYQIAEKLEQGQLHILFCMLGVAACLQLWIPCYLGTNMRNHAFAVCDACWHCGWHETQLGRMVRQDIIIFLLRAQQPVTIKFIGLPNVQLETFSSILSTSYSYFNMLRQYSS